MSLSSWLDGVVVVAGTLIPFFMIWACAVLWRRSHSAWALAALIGASSAVGGAVVIWVDFFHHYSSLAVMEAEDAAPPPETFHLAILLSMSIGFFIASLSLVGYARSLPK